ncbi:MAG: glycosyltransferase, partial [bacterium]|nr:glycosyltransferase [bacterium]
TIRKLSILIPVYNEIPTLEPLLRRVLEAPLPCDRELVVVDDCSTDGSREFLQAFAADHSEVHVVLQERNGGKGKAIRTAIEHATGDWSIIQDADLEYDPHDYGVMLEPVVRGIADAVFGSRFAMSRYRRAMYFWHTVANKTLTLAANVFSGLNLTDMETCYKLVRTDILQMLDLRSNGFDIEPELTLKLARWGARVYEVPISYQGRTYEEGKKIGAKDAVMALLALIRYRFLQPSFVNDHGFAALRSLERAKSFNRWMFAQFQPWLGRDVLEAGSGTGNLTKLMLDRSRLVAMDIDEGYVGRIDRAYGHLTNVSVLQGDLTSSDDLQRAADGHPFDSILSANVVEHIEDDAGVLRGFYDALKPGGRAVILVPHNPKLYCDLDKNLGHFRRYTCDDLSRKMEEAGFKVLKCWGFNRVGGLGWRLSGSWMRKQKLSPGQLFWFELAMPLIRILEYLPFHTPNSVIAVGEKPE